jgi:hypothetical protein
MRSKEPVGSWQRRVLATATITAQRRVPHDDVARRDENQVVLIHAKDPAAEQLRFRWTDGE